MNQPIPSDEEKPCVCVSVRTSKYRTSRGVAYYRELRFLKRRTTGFNFFEEDIAQIGADEAISQITNLNTVKDGRYKIVMVNMSYDYETGHLDSWDYELQPL